MKIQILAFEPRLDQNNVPESFEWQNKILYPYAVTYSMDGMQYRGEAFSASNPPWWEIGNSYDVNITQDAKREGGHKLTITRPPMPQHHTGGMQFAQPNQTPQQQFQQPTQTPTPQQQQPQPTAVSTPPPQQQQQQTNVPTRDDFRQALIVSQTSMKVASEYIPTLSEVEFNSLKGILQVETDIIPAFAKHIAHETYKIAYSIITTGKDDLPF